MKSSIMAGGTLGFRGRLEAELQHRAAAGELSKAQLTRINALSLSLARAKRALAKLEAGGIPVLPGEQPAEFAIRRTATIALERARLKDFDDRRLQWLMENL